MVSNDNKKISDVKNDFRAALILAGGKSSRMGRNKALLPIGHVTVIEFLTKRLRAVCNEVIVVTRSDQPYPHLDARVIFDVMPDKFSLGGLYSGLLQSPAEANFVCACDMPLVEPALVNYMFAQLSDYDAVAPTVNGHIEPLCAVYSKSCLAAIHSRLLADDLRMSGLLTQLRTKFLAQDELRDHDPDLRSFFNLNTATDYAHLLGLLEEEIRPC